MYCTSCEYCAAQAQLHSSTSESVGYTDWTKAPVLDTMTWNTAMMVCHDVSYDPGPADSTTMVKSNAKNITRMEDEFLI